MIALLLSGFASFQMVFLTFGFATSLAIKEVYHKEYYLFYYNNGLSKMNLWIFSFFLNVVFTLVIIGLTVIIKQLF